MYRVVKIEYKKPNLNSHVVMKNFSFLPEKEEEEEEQERVFNEPIVVSLLTFEFRASCLVRALAFSSNATKLPITN